MNKIQKGQGSRNIVKNTIRRQEIRQQKAKKA